MCPNHVENFIDSTLVSSTSLTERLKLWNQFGKSGSGNNFNPDTVKLEFFRRVRKGKLYERGVTKARVVNRDQRIRVPQYIKVQKLLPHFLKTHTVISRYATCCDFYIVVIFEIPESL